MPELNTNEELVRQYKISKEQGDTELASAILWRIIEKNTPMIHDRINAIAPEKPNLNEQDKEDLTQESMIAIMRAVEKYDETKARFSTYAYEKVQFAILEWLEKKYHLIYIPRQKQKAVSQYYEIVNGYKRNNNDRTPTDKYIKRMMDVDDATYKDIKVALSAYNIVSMDEETEQEEETVKFGDSIPDEKDYYMEYLIQDNKDRFTKVIMILKDKTERQILIDHFYNDMDFVEIAKNRGVTKQRINTIKKRAYEHLAVMPEAKNIAIELGIKPLDS